MVLARLDRALPRFALEKLLRNEAEVLMLRIIFFCLVIFANAASVLSQTTQPPQPNRTTCAQIAAELRQQYTLAFYSNASKAGEWHKLKVRISHSQLHSNLRLSYRRVIK
jgi:hypothetical protein